MTIVEISKIILVKPSDRLIFITIEDIGGSGKTTIAKERCAALGNAYVVNMDDFYY